jgi:nucleoside 2-deoxyribosyltransferase
MRKLYTAGKLYRAPMFRELREKYKDQVTINSRWIDMETFDDKDVHDGIKARGWIIDHLDVAAADGILVQADSDLRGALVEAGIALALGKPVLLVEDCHCFGTWQHHPNVRKFPDPHIAIETFLLGFELWSAMR